ncbi:MAG: NfeD family protein [Oscillospiraceae bacterium]
MNLTIFWAVLVISLTILELFTEQFVSIWFAVASLISFFISLKVDSFTITLIVFIFMSTFLLILTKPIVGKITKNSYQKTNSDSLIGRSCVVKKEIDANKKGRVYIDGLSWAASSYSGCCFKEEDVCMVREIQGVTLIVENLIDLEEKL